MPKVYENPGLVGAADTISSPPPSVPVAANVALKLPVFWLDAAEVWFAQADAQFAIKTISVSKMEVLPRCGQPSLGRSCSDLRPLRAPPAVDQYEVLMERLTTL